jgi:LacI family transcriptional regulator, kdg operon repressor
MKTITISDVAKHANVSKSTVSQYLNKRYDYMGEKTKTRIEEAIEELGYQPNIVARSLKQKSTSTIGVIVANILHAFTTQVIRAIEDHCHESDFHIIVCNADEDPEKEKKYIEMLRAKQVDGLIIFPTGGNVTLYQKMLDEKFPVMFMDRSVEEVSIPSFLLDNKKAARLAVDYFVNKGHERIGIVTASIMRSLTPRIERIQGYKEALSDHGIKITDEYIKSSDIDKIQDELKDLFSSDNPPQALLAGNDLALIEILKFIKENNMRIPEDISVVGIDDVSFANLFSPPITTIAQPAFEMGKAAAEQLLETIQKNESKQTNIHRFEPKLIIRES